MNQEFDKIIGIIYQLGVCHKHLGNKNVEQATQIIESTMHKLLDDCEKDKLNKSFNTILADIQDKIGTLDTKQITNIT